LKDRVVLNGDTQPDVRLGDDHQPAFRFFGSGLRAMDTACSIAQRTRCVVRLR